LIFNKENLNTSTSSNQIDKCRNCEVRYCDLGSNPPWDPSLMWVNFQYLLSFHLSKKNIQIQDAQTMLDERNAHLAVVEAEPNKV